jgi:pyrimidine-nucleoside phosphorylase
LGFLITDFLKHKRDGHFHSSNDLKSFVDGFLRGEIPDYQVSAWLMAVYFRGLSPQELVDWTEVMWKSGRSVRREPGQGFWIDKHSTGGVGDKTSLILVPLVSALADRLLGERRVRIPMISGRGLGMTGGTLDKLDSVPKFQSQLKLEEAYQLLQSQGFFMAGQSDDLAPADRRIYSLRDVTATVESIPLVVSSILSKKLAESIDGLVMDVKVGRGASFKRLDEARALADELLRVGRKMGLKMTALLTAMDEPLGYCTGHAIEMEECAEFLAGPHRHPGLLAVVKRLALEMMQLASRGKLEDALLEAEIDRELQGTEAQRRFVQMLESQQGDWKHFVSRDRTSHLVVECPSPRDGVVATIDAGAIAILLRDLGGGRKTKEQGLDLEVGVRLKKIPGESVSKGECVAELVVQKGADAAYLQRRFFESLSWSAEPVSQAKWILDVMRS